MTDKANMYPFQEIGQMYPFQDMGQNVSPLLGQQCHIWTQTPTPACPQLPTDPAERKDIPIVRGCLDYFPNALAEVASLSWKGNQQHNPNDEMHWARGKSTDEADCIVRHLMERGTVDTDGVRHSAKVAWRALALLQKEIEEAEGLPISRASRP